MNKWTVNYGGMDFALAYPNATDAIPAQWQMYQTFYEYGVLHALAQMRLRGVYVDVGANVGNHAVFFAAFCPSTLVVCVEPVVELLPYLVENMRTNTRCHPYMVVPFAVSDGCGNGSIQYGRTPDLGGGELNRSTGAGIVQTLDALTAGLGKIALLKLDVENHEFPAIRGAKKLLSDPARRPDVVVVEAWCADALRTNTEALRKHGYTNWNKVEGNWCPTYIYEGEWYRG